MCQDDPTVAAVVDRDNREAMEYGGRGTPFSVVVTPNKNLIPVNGAIPEDQLRDVIETARMN